MGFDTPLGTMSSFIICVLLYVDLFVSVATQVMPRRWGGGAVESNEAFDARWEAYFQRFVVVKL